MSQAVTWSRVTKLTLSRKDINPHQRDFTDSHYEEVPGEGFRHGWIQQHKCYHLEFLSLHLSILISCLMAAFADKHLCPGMALSWSPAWPLGAPGWAYPHYVCGPGEREHPFPKGISRRRMTEPVHWALCPPGINGCAHRDTTPSHRDRESDCPSRACEEQRRTCGPRGSLRAAAQDAHCTSLRGCLPIHDARGGGGRRQESACVCETGPHAKQSLCRRHATAGKQPRTAHPSPILLYPSDFRGGPSRAPRKAAQGLLSAQDQEGCG